MKLTKQTLRRIIKEELEAVMNEVRVAPDQNQEVGDVEKLANKHIALGHDSMVDSLGDYFTELDKFGDREQSRGRSLRDTSKEFYDRYKGVEDTYEPKGLSESSDFKGKKK